MINRYLSITQYSQAFGLSPHSVRNQITSGKLPANKEGNCWLITVNENELPLNIEVNEELNLLLIKQLQDQVEDFKEQIQFLKKDNEDKSNQINQLLVQQDQSQQIIMSMNQQKLLASKKNWFIRLFRLNEENA